MENIESVFCTTINRTEKYNKNNLYDLLNIVPATPIRTRDRKPYNCDFKPRTDKYYMPKKRHGLKVKTVRDIRASFENDTYLTLTNDIESQEKYLLKKIKSGTARDEKTIKVAKKLLKAKDPISRGSWQMLININPEDHIYPKQYVQWKGKKIQVNGSYGGKNKLIWNYDLFNTKISLKRERIIVKTHIPNKKKGLLQNSLAIKFKPGPLGRKKFLDESHQKYQGDIELVDLPKVNLVVQPTYGTALDPTIVNFISHFRKEDGTISKEWAEFTVSVLGKIDNSNAKLCSEDVSFVVKYKCNQNRLLMRKDLENYMKPKVINTCIDNTTAWKSSRTTDHLNVLPEVHDIITKILDAVEINLLQDNMFTTDENMKDTMADDTNANDFTVFTKDKPKRKYCELDRLDVTVIRLPKPSEKKSSILCGNEFCTLGCVCDSLKGTYHFKQHCGRQSCIFDCKCDFTKYRSVKSLEVAPDMLPGLISIEDEINMRLAKEEKKFHQTVIVTGENNILLKSEKRTWKSSKKYENFYKNLCLKSSHQKNKQDLVISAVKLNCNNIEPWCMVHNLYKCFCRGKFTKSSTFSLVRNCCIETTPILQRNESPDGEYSSDKIINSGDLTERSLRSRARQESSNLGLPSAINAMKNKTRTVPEILNTDQLSLELNNCSRLNAYKGRKYNDDHYKRTNVTIKEWKKNDKNLRNRFMNILKTALTEEQCIAETSQDEEQQDTSPAKQSKNDKYTEQKIPKFKNHETKTSQEKETLFVQGSKDKSMELVDSIQERIQTISLKAQSLNNSHPIEFFCDFDDSCDGGTTKKRNPQDKTNFASWLESSYKLYKYRMNRGYEPGLGLPKTGKMALHSWEFILKRYKDRKNVFFISQQTPFRIFIGIHTYDPFFGSCININNIRFADLHKYPITVYNLLTNATNVKNSFYILRGLSQCWELVGSVVKINKNDENIEEHNAEPSVIEYNFISNQGDISEKPITLDSDEQSYTPKQSLIENDSTSQCLKEPDSSKWFVMTVENDFSEVRFLNKGFFVKFDNIIKAIHSARCHGKTIRLSSQKCAEISAHFNSGLQFGVYAIPNTNEYSVFIGPYEMQEPLGMETFQTNSELRSIKKTRGFWINTNKVDNLKVIHNPLLFMPSPNSKVTNTVSLESHSCDDVESNFESGPEIIDSKDISKESQTNSLSNLVPESGPEIIDSKDISKESQTNSLSNLVPKKIVKPIKICKTNGFYHLATDGLFKKITLKSPSQVSEPSLKKSSSIVGTDMVIQSSPLQSLSKNTTSSDIEDAKTGELNDIDINSGVTQIKISSVFSQKEESNTVVKKSEKSMLILKPEEINRKVVEEQYNTENASPPRFIPNDSSDNLDNIVIENSLFEDNLETLPTITPCTVSSDVCVISSSDDDDDTVLESVDVEHTDTNRWQDVLIQCTNVTDLGWIWGRQELTTRLLSFKVPGGEYSVFYPEEEAFQKLNQALSTKLSPTKSLTLKWNIIDSFDKVKKEMNSMDYEILSRVLRRRENESSERTTKKNVYAVKTYSRKSTPSPSTFTSYVTESNAKVELPTSTEEN